MKNQPKEPPQFIVKFANLVFFLGILLSIFIIFYVIYKIYTLINLTLLAFYIFTLICGGVFATLFGFGLKKFNNNLKVNLSLLFFISTVTIYGVETYLAFTSSQRETIIKQMGYDTRTTMEVLVDLRESGIEAFPNPIPKKFAQLNGLTTKKGRIYPLGTISNSTTILTNESGFYPIIETDERGFNNPKGLYNKKNIDIILIGDSFVEGLSVFSNETISAVLRQLDFNVLSIGKEGNGSLLEFAILKEYVKPLKPKIVLWFYCENDLFDLSFELQSSLLKKYLNEDYYSQNLISRQKEIDDVLINYLQIEWKKEKKEIAKEKIIKIIKLTKLRNMINLQAKARVPASSQSVFTDILHKSKQMVSEWDGKMYFVYLPLHETYSTGNVHVHRDFVMQTATELGISIIDMYSKMFLLHPDPLSLFPFRLNSHYNARGYRLVAETIGKRLESDGYIKIK